MQEGSLLVEGEAQEPVERFGGGIIGQTANGHEASEIELNDCTDGIGAQEHGPLGEHAHEPMVEGAAGHGIDEAEVVPTRTPWANSSRTFAAMVWPTKVIEHCSF